MVERVSVRGIGGDGEYERHQRLYRADELRDALHNAGFTDVGLFARPDGTSFEPALSPAIWIAARRSAASAQST
jgi:hypothetical protein